MDLIKNFKEKASSKKKCIVLPEGEDSRIIQAAGEIINNGFADLIILGSEKKIQSQARDLKTDLTGVKIIDPLKSDLHTEFAEKFYELRKHKGITEDDARETMKDPLYFGTMLVHTEDAEGMVAGAINATGKVLRPGFQIIKTKEGISIVSGLFIMILPDSEMGEDGILIFADCAVNPDPDANQLAEIAAQTAETTCNLLDIEPVVAMLSFSTHGSAKHELVEKVQQATEQARKLAPELKIDGELQLDSALVPEVSKLKAPDSPIAGRANTLIFPDLQSGNIGYKLVQRLAGAEAIGPILQGMAKPVNDLSRGCSVEDVVDLVVITAVQAQTNQGGKK